MYQILCTKPKKKMEELLTCCTTLTYMLSQRPNIDQLICKTQAHQVVFTVHLDYRNERKMRIPMVRKMFKYHEKKNMNPCGANENQEVYKTSARSGLMYIVYVYVWNTCIKHTFNRKQYEINDQLYYIRWISGFGHRYIIQKYYLYEWALLSVHGLL